MAVQKVVAEKWEKITGCKLSEGYGTTESSPVATINPLDGSGRIGTIGLPVPSTDVRIVDENGKIVGVATTRALINHIAAHFPTAVYNLPPDPHRVSSAPDGA